MDALAERLSRYSQSPMSLNQPPADSDGDGMPDCWETGHMLDADDPADASLDRDNDGLTNLQEYELCTHPGRADSDYDGIDDGEDPFPINEDYADGGGTGAGGAGGAGCAARESAASQPWEYALLTLLVLVGQSARRRGYSLRGTVSI